MVKKIIPKKTIRHLLVLSIANLMLISCSKEEGSTFSTDYVDPLYPELVIEEISSESYPDSDLWRFKKLDYSGNRPLFFAQNYFLNLVALDDDSGEILWITKLSPPGYFAQVLGISDYKGQLIVFSDRSILIISPENGNILEEIVPGEYLDRVFVNGFAIVEDKVYVLTSLPTFSRILIELFEFDLEQKVGYKLFEKSDISGMETSQFIMPVDETKDYLFFAREIYKGVYTDSYIFKINRHTGEDVLFFTGSTQAQRPISGQKFSYINGKFVYSTNGSNLVYSIVENRVIGQTQFGETYYHGKYYFTWLILVGFKAFTLEDLKPVWSDLYGKHTHRLTSHPAVHPNQDIVCVPTRSSVHIIDIATGRMLYILKMSDMSEEVTGVRINDDGTKLYVFTSLRGIYAYTWPF